MKANLATTTPTTEDSLAWDSSGWEAPVKQVRWLRLDRPWLRWAGHWRWSMVNRRTGEVAIRPRRALTERAAWRRSHRAYLKALTVPAPGTKS